MSSLLRKFNLAYILTGILFCSGAASAWGADSTSKASITVTVTAVAPHQASPPPIPQEDVIASSGSTHLHITSWVRAQGNNANLQLAILIDNDLGSSFVGQEIQQIKDFINSQPPTTSVGVFYAENGAAETAIQFTADHAAAANSLRFTAGHQGNSPSIYLSLADLASHWPAVGMTRREVLVIGSGFDPLSPGAEDPYADATIDKVEAAGINVHTILVPNPRYAQTQRNNNSEDKLIDVTHGSGGQVLFDSAFAPASLAPPLDELNATLNNQYLLTFTINRSRKKKGEIRPLRVDTEDHSVKLTAPRQVLVPGPAGPD